MKLAKTSLLLSIGLLVTAAIVVLPSASAQQNVCTGIGISTLTYKTVGSPSQPIAPITGTQNVPVTVTYSWEKSASIGAITITLVATSKAPYAKVTVNPPSSTILIPQDNQANSGTKDANFNVQIRFTREAPAFEDVDFAMTASATPGTCVAKPPDASTTFQAKPAFYGKISATLDRAIYKSSQNNQLSVPMTIENFGNGQIKTFFDVKGGSSKSKGIQVVTPQPVIIDSPFQGGKSTKQVVKLDINTPFKNGYMNGVNAVTVDITTRSTDQTDIEGDKAALSLLVRTQGVYVPGFDSVLLVAALAGAALLVRARRAS